MDEKISLKAVDQYSEAFVSRVTASFFESREKITGQDILGLCEIKQINLFIIRELLRAWRLESQKLKSPFFDYQTKEVTEALTVFQNVLSNHIAISKEDFIPLFRKAVSQTIYLFLDPYDFYSDVLDTGTKEYVRVDDLKLETKYLKINRPPLEQLLRKLEEKKLDLVPGKQAFAMLDQILEEVNFTPEDVDAYIGQFSKVVPLSVENLYEKKSEVKVVSKATVSSATSGVPKATLAENFQKIVRIKDSLTINQKFMFTKILFDGDFEKFSRTIDHLDHLQVHDDALRYLDKNYPDWDKEGEEYEEFMELVANRFS